MNICRSIIVIVLMFVAGGFTPDPAIDKISLLDLKGKPVTLQTIHSKKATVIVFLSPECPLCQSYTLTLNKLSAQYRSKHIDFIGVVPTTDFPLADILEYKRYYKLSFQLLRDPDNALVKALKATITPEVFVLDPKGKVKYSGRIDNWAYELGRKRKVITEHDLENAIKAILANKPVTVTKTKPIGCFIE